MPIVAWYILSKESYMKRVMSDVLPTVRHEGQRGFDPPIQNLPRTALLAEEDQSI
jgi:hypothetical protein